MWKKRSSSSILLLLVLDTFSRDSSKQKKVYKVIFLSLNLWRPPSVALYLKRSQDLGTCKKAVVESLFWEMTFTSSQLIAPGHGTNCHFQEDPPVKRVVGSDGAAKNLLVHPRLALAKTLVGTERLSSAMVANSQWSLAILPCPTCPAVLRVTKL